MKKLDKLSSIAGIISAAIALIALFWSVYTYWQAMPDETAQTPKIHTDYRIISKFRSILSKLDQTEYAGTSFDYWPDCGLRNAYYHIVGFMSFADLQDIFGGKIFISGPHTTSTLNLHSKYDFGHYNKDFIKWINVNLNAALSDKQFIEKTKPLYEKFLSKIITNYALVWMYLDKHKSLKKSLLTDYKTHIENKTLPDSYIQQTTLVELFDHFMTKKETEKTLKATGDDAKTDFSGLLPIVLGLQQLATDRRHILARDNVVREELKLLMQKGDSNILAPAIYFWLRRSLDKTESDIYSIMQTLLEKYDSATLYNLRSMVAFEGQ